MATLQNIRSKGPLLVIVIGLALFAFIAGDAWKVMQPHQAHDVGEVNGDALSAQEYQNLVEEYTEVVKLMRGVTALNDEQTNQVRDEVWRSYVNNKLIEKEAKALGLTVSAAEIQDILKAGVHPLLRQTPFQNPQTGNFDKDMLNKFLVETTLTKFVCMNVIILTTAIWNNIGLMVMQVCHYKIHIGYKIASTVLPTRNAI